MQSYFKGLLHHKFTKVKPRSQTQNSTHVYTNWNNYLLLKVLISIYLTLDVTNSHGMMTFVSHLEFTTKIEKVSSTTSWVSRLNLYKVVTSN